MFGLFTAGAEKNKIIIINSSTGSKTYHSSSAIFVLSPRMVLVFVISSIRQASRPRPTRHRRRGGRRFVIPLRTPLKNKLDGAHRMASYQRLELKRLPDKREYVTAEGRYWRKFKVLSFFSARVS
jgi:hypothetical protein